MLLAEEDLEALHVAFMSVVELAAQIASLTAENEHTRVEHDILADRIRKPDVAAVTLDGELGGLVRSVRSLKGRIAAVEDIAKTAEAQACETLDRMSELQALVEWLN